MERTETVIEADRAAVWAALADPRSYPDWLVGAQEIRHVEGDWPEPGASFHHEVGVGPLRIEDSTTVLEVEPRRRLRLKARARPTGVATVEFRLEDAPQGTRVVLTEAPSGGPARWLWVVGGKLVMAPGLRARNERSLDQLRRFVLGAAETRV